MVQEAYIYSDAKFGLPILVYVSIIWGQSVSMGGAGPSVDLGVMVCNP
jgi:hypothetical protein